MKKSKYLLSIVILIILIFTGCTNSSETDSLRQENKELKQQIFELQKDTNKTSNTSVETKVESEFNVKFNDDGNSMIFGNSEHIAEINNASVVYSPQQDKYILTIDFHYKNNENESHNFINDLYCNVAAYQDGIELDTPGITSEKGVYNTNSEYTRIKNAEIDAQLAFVLNDTESSVELELGSDYYSSLIIKTVVISKKQLY